MREAQLGKQCIYEQVFPNVPLVLRKIILDSDILKQKRRKLIFNFLV